MPSEQLSRLMWVAFIAAFLGLCWQMRDRLELMFATRGELTIEEQSRVVVLRWRGKIEAPLGAKLEEAFAAHARMTRRFVIALHSPGGTLEHGRDVIRLIKQMQQTHTVDTVVEERRICASMCVAVYLTGAQRTAAANARFMFHEVSYHDSLSGKVENVPKEAIGRATDQFFERYLKPAGLDARWLAEMRAAIRGKDVWRTADELVKQGSGVVQRIE